ncbi:DEAD-domain-containing protein [Lentinus brumalis]|uniref:ATP-dependent RNA helicase n=1 Tax=Lentinus brumalis TaxID=2498619 RepID=A0A371DQA6_9APHY|nr:DEAD-domain-containing protein [Polyporus brumalis]
MAATLWSRTFGHALAPAARVCRSSQGALALHALRAGRFVSARHVSTDFPVPDHKVEKATWSSEAPSDTHASYHTESAEEGAPAPALAHSDQPKFESLEGAVSSRTLRALTDRPFRLVHMSPVQAAVLPLLPKLVEPVKEGEEPEGPRDLLVKARTGTGKTLGFLIPAVEKRLNALRAHAEQVATDTETSSKVTLARAVDQFAKKNVGALIISPTRELATQIAQEAIKLTQHHERFEVQLLVGGLPKRKQLRDWNLGRRDIIVATPGRLRDFIENDPGFKEDLQTTQMFILDEADTLLEMGFREEISAISEHLPKPPARQTFMFSATMATAIEQVARQVLAKNHTFIDCVPKDSSPIHLQIPQYYTAVPSPEEQLPHVLRLIAEDQLANPGKSKVLIFLPTTRLVQLYSTILGQVGREVLPAGQRTRFMEMHSKKAMNSRMRTSDLFRRDRSGATVMITSDVSARGVDYPGITRVIQVGVPEGRNSYVHRVGRTGRGKDHATGRADLVLLPWELGFLTWQMMDIPLKELTTNQVQTNVTALAQQHDASPGAFFPQKTHRGRDERDRYSPLQFQTPVLDRLEKIPEAIKELQPSLDKEEVIQALTTILAFYAAHASSLRVQKSVAVAGVQQLAEALVGENVQMRVPREFLDNSKVRFEPRKNRWEERGSKNNRAPWQSRGKVDRTFRQRSEDSDGDGERRERRPWSPERTFQRDDRSSGRPFQRDGDRSFGRPFQRDGDRSSGRPFQRDGDRSFGRPQRDGDGDRSFGRPQRDGDRSFGRPFQRDDRSSGRPWEDRPPRRDDGERAPRRKYEEEQ